MNARIVRRYNSFADYPRYEYVLRISGQFYMLDNLYLGLTVEEAKASMAELNSNREKLGLYPIIVEF